MLVGLGRVQPSTRQREGIDRPCPIVCHVSAEYGRPSTAGKPLVRSMAPGRITQRGLPIRSEIVLEFFDSSPVGEPRNGSVPPIFVPGGTNVRGDLPHVGRINKSPLCHSFEKPNSANRAHSALLSEMNNTDSNMG